MKKAQMELSSIFCVDEEMVKSNGEDCFYYEVSEDRFIIASLDGCGGSGSKKYENYSGKTGAYVASRAVCGGVAAWFREEGNEDALTGYIQKALSVCQKYGDKASRIMGSLGKTFPTTAAICSCRLYNNRLEAVLLWAGDSRCYLLDCNGLHQLTEDDLDCQDAMSNLTNDGVMTNVISAEAPFEIHSKRIALNSPCILLTATDGCFGYLSSPMEFEHLLTDTLLKSKNPIEWKMLLNDSFHAVAGDDYTLCAALWGFKDFEQVKKTFEKRNALVVERYLNSKDSVTALWEIYKKEYSIYL